MENDINSLSSLFSILNNWMETDIVHNFENLNGSFLW